MNTETFAEIIGDIDEEYVKSAENRASREKGRPRYKRVLLTAAAAAAIMLLAGAVFAAIKLYAKPSGSFEAAAPENTVDPAEAWKQPVTVPEDAVFAPVRKPKGTSHAMRDYNYFYGFRSAYEHADAVCLVTVENWLSENFFCTFFEVSVDKVYKGEIPDKIALRQEANSGHSAYNTPLFTYGNKLLVFLYKYDRWDEGVQRHENAYEIMVFGTGYLIYAQDKSGGDYLIDLIGDISRATKQKKEAELSDCYTRSLINELIVNIQKQDIALARTVELFTHDSDRIHEEYDGDAPMRVYRFEDIEALLNEMAEG